MIAFFVLQSILIGLTGYSLPSNLITLSPGNTRANVYCSNIIRDGIVLEGRETFSLQLPQRSSGQLTSGLMGTTIDYQ